MLCRIYIQMYGLYVDKVQFLAKMNYFQVVRDCCTWQKAVERLPES